MIAEPKDSLLRERELEQLIGWLGDAFKGNGSVILISGPSGIGKTRLTEELERIASSIGFCCLRGACQTEPGRPWQLFGELLDAPAERPDGRSPQTEKSPLALLDRMRRRCEQQAVLLRLENVHWAGREQVALLHYLARNIGPLRALIVCTYQPAEMAITSDGPVPFLEAIRLMRREGLCQEIELLPLDRPQTEEVVREQMGGEVDGALLEDIWVNSEGNPLVALELARLLVQGKKVEFVDGRWVRKGEAIIEMPDSFQELAERKIELLSLEDRRVVESASAIGEVFDVQLLSDILYMDRLELLERLDMLAREHRLLIERGVAFQFISRSTHLAAYHHIAPLRKKELHHIIAVAMERSGRHDAAAIALQCYLAGRKQECICYSLLAGQECKESDSWAEAVECYQRAVEVSEGDLPQLKRRAEEELADARSRMVKGENRK